MSDDEVYNRRRDTLNVELSQACWDAILNSECDFYGAADNQFRLNSTTWEAVEDPDDGYRSHLGFIEANPEKPAILFNEPIARIMVERFVGKRDDNDYYDMEGYRLRDVVDGHVWLYIGTDGYDDYYPCFVFDYRPKVTP